MQTSYMIVGYSINAGTSLVFSEKSVNWFKPLDTLTLNIVDSSLLLWSSTPEALVLFFI